MVVHAQIHRLQRQFGEAEGVLAHANRIAHNTGDPLLNAAVNAEMGYLTRDQGHFDVAQRHFRQALSRYQELHDHFAIGRTYKDLFDLLVLMGDKIRARVLVSECLVVCARWMSAAAVERVTQWLRKLDDADEGGGNVKH